MTRTSFTFLFIESPLKCTEYIFIMNYVRKTFVAEPVKQALITQIFI